MSADEDGAKSRRQEASARGKSEAGFMGRRSIVPRSAGDQPRIARHRRRHTMSARSNAPASGGGLGPPGTEHPHPSSAFAGSSSPGVSSPLPVDPPAPVPAPPAPPAAAGTSTE